MSPSVLSLPSERMTAPAAGAGSRPMASRTCDAFSDLLRQPVPLATAMPRVSHNKKMCIRDSTWRSTPTGIIRCRIFSYPCCNAWASAWTSSPPRPAPCAVWSWRNSGAWQDETDNSQEVVIYPLSGSEAGMLNYSGSTEYRCPVRARNTRHSPLLLSSWNGNGSAFPTS